MAVDNLEVQDLTVCCRRNNTILSCRCDKAATGMSFDLMLILSS